MINPPLILIHIVKYYIKLHKKRDVKEISLAVDESMDPEEVDVDEMAEEILEGHQEEDVGFDVVENHQIFIN